MTLVDTNVLIDLVQDDPQWADWSEEQLLKAQKQGSLFINPIGYAELVPAMANMTALDDFLKRSTIVVKDFSRPTAYLAGEMLMARARIKMVQVPYKGAAPAMMDLIGGRVDGYFLGMPAVMPHVKGGNVRLIAVSTARRAAIANDVPSVAEQGMPGFDFSLWGGIFAPAQTPKDIVGRLNGEILLVLTQPDMRAQLAREGSEVIETTPETFARFVQAESRKYAELLREIGYRPE